MTKPEVPFEFCPICGEKMTWMLVSHMERHNNDCPKGHVAIDVYFSGKVKSRSYGSANSVEEFHRKLKLKAFE